MKFVDDDDDDDDGIRIWDRRLQVCPYLMLSLTLTITLTLLTLTVTVRLTLTLPTLLTLILGTVVNDSRTNICHAGQGKLPGKSGTGKLF